MLDTSTLPARDREEALRSALDGATLPAQLEPAEATTKVDVRLQVWQFEGGATLFSAQGNGMKLSRTRGHVSSTDEPLISLSMQPSGRALFRQRDHIELIDSDSMFLADMREAYHYHWTGQGQSVTFQVPLATLELNTEDIRKAAYRLSASPLHRLVRDHVLGVAGCADSIDDETARATTSLIRALVVSALCEIPRLTAPNADAHCDAVRSYVRWHLREPWLDARRISIAAGISTLQLRALCERHGVSLDAWIARQRADGARRDLERADPSKVSLAKVATSWGFDTVGSLRRAMLTSFGLAPEECLAP